MSGYFLKEGVPEDLEIIWDSIAQDKVFAADRWIERLYEAFETIARRPAIGHLRKDLTSLPILFWPVGAYLILYSINGELVEILAVTQGSRDIPRLLSQRM